MDCASLESLTDRQRDCLRLVARDRSAKEIGQALGISHETVAKHIGAAMRTLGASSRFVAARALAEHEGRTQALGSQPIGIGDRSEPADTDIAYRRPVGPTEGDALHLTRSGYRGEEAGDAFAVGTGRAERPQELLGTRARLLLPILVALGAVVLLILTAAASDTIGEFARAIR